MLRPQPSACEGRSGRRLLTGVALLAASAVLCAAGSAEINQAGQGRTQTIRTAGGAHSLSQEQAAHGYPVHLRAVVTYYDPYIDKRHGALWVHDASGGVFVRIPSRPILPLRAGDVLDLKGVTAPGDYAPLIDQAQLKVVDKSHVPETAPRVTVTQMLSGSEDAEWVEVEGMVHAIHSRQENVMLDLATTDGPLGVLTVRDKNVNYDAYVDSRVRVRGIVAPLFNRSAQMVGTHLFFPSLEDLKVVEAAPRDAFASQALPLTRLLRFVSGQELAHRAHVQGWVTLQWPGRMLCIQNGLDGLCMQTSQETRASVGSLVDVVGFPAIAAYKPTLEAATFQLAGKNEAGSLPGIITADNALRGEVDGRLVRIEGELIGQDLSGNDPTLMLRSGKFLIPVVLPRDVVGPGLLPWKDGSTVRVTGICDAEFSSTATKLGEGGVRPESARVLLRSVDDVVLIHTPTWWTPEHTLGAFAIVGIVVLASMAWIIFLRLQVEQRTRALRLSEERLRFLSQHDSLTNLPNRVLLNDRLQQAVKRAERFEACLGVLMVDIDGFKEVNDELGHEAGDKLLCELALRLKESVRATDTVARVGGDEFVVLLPDLRIPVEAEIIAGKVLAAVAKPVDVGAGEVAISASIGVSIYPDGGTDVDSLLRTADAAMYSVKAHGKKGFEVYSPKMTYTVVRTPEPRGIVRLPLPEI